MYKQMLVPLDGSELAEEVLPYAEEVAARLDLGLTLLHCEPPGAETTLMCNAYLERATGIIRKHTMQVRSSLGESARQKDVQVKAEVVTGNPAEEILRHIEEDRADIIMMATHGHSGLGRWMMGSVAEKVLRKSKVPVWLVRTSPPDKVVHQDWFKRKILVPLDGSKFAEVVLPHVEVLAAQHSAEPVNVVLMRVYERPFITADYPEPDWNAHVQRMIDHFKGEAEKYLAGVQKRLSDSGLNVRAEVLMGKPAEEIIRYADENSPNLIVMATHGASGLSVWEYGDITDKILHGVTSPVFLVRPQKS